jgi:hypothetical protein
LIEEGAVGALGAAAFEEFAMMVNSPAGWIDLEHSVCATAGAVGRPGLHAWSSRSLHSSPCLRRGVIHASQYCHKYQKTYTSCSLGKTFIFMAATTVPSII